VIALGILWWFATVLVAVVSVVALALLALVVATAVRGWRRR
jgi:hypothetical protein